MTPLPFLILLSEPSLLCPLSSFSPSSPLSSAQLYTAAACNPKVQHLQSTYLSPTITTFLSASSITQKPKS